MALNLEDRLLGNKAENYVSSSEDEDNGDTGSNGGADSPPTAPVTSDNAIPPSRSNRTANVSIPILLFQLYVNLLKLQTGPKGVIEDYRDYNRWKAECEHENKLDAYARFKAA